MKRLWSVLLVLLGALGAEGGVCAPLTDAQVTVDLLWVMDVTESNVSCPV